MKTFDEAFDAALGVPKEPESERFALVQRNLQDLSAEILSNPKAQRWVAAMVELAWEKTDAEISSDEVAGFFLSGLLSGVRIGIEMEKAE